MSALDFGARAMAAQLRQRAARHRLASRIRSNIGRYETPDLVPCAIMGLTQRATATAYAEGDFAAQDALVLRCIKAGTSSGSATLGITDPAYITDNTAIWALFGTIAPIAFANNLAMVLGQQFAAYGMLFKVTAAGTTHASDPAPSTPASGTHGSVGYAYVGRQVLPLVSVGTSALAGTSLQVAWNSANLVTKGGTRLQQGANQRAALRSASRDGLAYTTSNSIGGGSWLYQCDAQLWSLSYNNRDYGSYHWVDGKLAAFTYIASSSADRHIAFDASGLPRATRNLRHKTDYNFQVYGVYATASDTIRAWDGHSPVKAVFLADSFGEQMFGWTGRLADRLGLEDAYISGIGSAGIVWDGSYVSITDRFTIDVVNRQPDLVVLALSPNDNAFISAGGSAAQVADAFEVLVRRLRGETQAELVVVGVWNNRGPLTSGNAYDIDVACEVRCAALGVPYIKWRDLLSDGGYVGNASGSGSSKRLTAADGTHPAGPFGDRLRARNIEPRLIERLETLG